MNATRIAYVVKRYPRYSETFIVNELLAHEAAGLELEIFSLLAPADSHFQNAISLVRAPVHYLPCDTVKAADFWNTMQQAAGLIPDFWARLGGLRGQNVRDVQQALALAVAVKRRNIHYLHAHFASAATAVARMASHLTGVPYSFTAHAKDIYHRSVGAEDLDGKLRDAAAVITVSDYNLDYLRKQFGTAAQRVVRVFNGLDLERFPYCAPKERPRRIVGVGRLVEKKGFQALIAACAVLERHGVEYGCDIVGSGELEPALRAQVESERLTHRVRLIGPRPQNETIRLIQSAGVFAAPCVIGSDGNRDGMPTVLLEAMALGTPCVSTDVTGIPEVVQHERTGLLVAQNDPEALASAIERLLVEPALGLRLAEEARRLIEAEFDIHKNTAKVRQLLGWGR